jgi:exonuclease III
MTNKRAYQKTAGMTSKKKRRVHDLKIMSWNIHDIRMKDEGLKSSLKDINDLLMANDLICLQETKEPVKIADFRCYNSNRKTSRSGGVCICIKNDISKGVVSINTKNCEDVVAVKLKKSFFAMPHDVAVINVYDSPANSSFKKNSLEDISTLDNVSTIIQQLDSDTEIILVGDFNARTGIESDQDDPHFDPHSLGEQDFPVTVPKRSNKDSKLNSNGKPFIEFVKANELVITNGRTLGDIYGEMTCHKYNGSSAVDYICSSTNIIGNVRTMKVGQFSPFSDHSPLHLCFSLGCLNKFISGTAIPEFSDAPVGFKWKDDERSAGDRFEGAQDIPDIASVIKKLLDSKIECEDDVFSLNNKVLDLYASLASRSLTRKSSKRSNKKKWFDWECRAAKKDLNKAAKHFDANQMDDDARSHFHTLKKSYKKLIKAKKADFAFDVNKRIEEGSNINWKTFKGLKELYTDEESFDTYDLFNFYTFFKELYDKRCKKDSHAANTQSSPTIPQESDLEELNEQFSDAEIDAAIKKLKPNKAVSLDLISNEMLKHSKRELRDIIKVLFNKCLQYGIYPWNNSVTTPLHKKGDKENPDNYRAITLGSCLGKLFSALVLDRLSMFRRNNCPDLPNQLGFCKGSQTSDHILTLKTLIDKYVSNGRKRLFTCFVDYRKAFDRVCRDALLYKLSHLGFAGNIFNCIQHMYNNSSTRIKLIKKISDAIDVGVGTEQGHPLSPELFKLFVHDLSVELNNLTQGNFPVLSDTLINHLLWADDLVLIALDKESLQKMIDILHNYVETWELEVNITKTNIMVFNTSGKILKVSREFTLGATELEPVKNYTYLGVTFSLNGSFKVAIAQLTSKARRAYFQLKRTVDTRALSVKSLFILFDSLIRPILTYASQVWIPFTNIGKALLKAANTGNNSEVLIQSSSKDCFELMHLQFIKWCLGVHRKASNLGCYGDTGRIPIAITAIDPCVKYFRRLASISVNDPSSLVGKAYLEQQSLGMSWYQTWNAVANSIYVIDNDSNLRCSGSNAVKCTFVDEWETKRHSQNKLTFYNSIKPNFGYEPYLNIKSSNSRKHLTRLRISAHDLNIERGRYVTKDKAPSFVNRLCRFCYSTEDKLQLELLEGLPCFSPNLIIETEQHAITECPGYHHLRLILSEHLKSQLLRCDYAYILNHPILAEELGSFLKKSFYVRNPKSTLKNIAFSRRTKIKKTSRR